MKNGMSLLLVTMIAGLAAGCATTPLAPDVRLQQGVPVLIPASPESGFHYPYLLQIPKTAPSGTTRLLVEPNNTGAVSDDPAVHLEAAHRLARNALGASIAARLEIPFLVPVFPRPQSDWKIYTHQLDRDSMRIASGPMRRLDLQLLAMVDDARRRLRTAGIDVHDRVLMTGFSASGTFANRFTILHPTRIRAVASGGLNGLLMVPAAAVDSVTLGYPIGTADVKALTGKPVNLEAWRLVPQFIYMGELDDNDALQFDDGYDEDERAIVYEVLGERMQPVRWGRVQQIYRDAGASVTFRTYAGIGHATDRRIADEVTAFFRSHL